MKDDDIGEILQSQADDFARWQGDVQRQLREGDLRNAPGDRVLQYLELSSFGIPSVLNVYSLDRGNEYRVTWTVDNQTTRARLGKEEFERRYLRLCSLGVPMLLPSEQPGLDGTTYELAIGSVWLGWRLHWWEELPKQWGELNSEITELISYLRASVAHGETM